MSAVQVSPVQVKRRDPGAEAYRIETLDGSALVPECLMDGLRPGARPSHQEAYEWIARNRRSIALAVKTLAQGGKPRPPFDLLHLTDPAASSF